MMTLVISYLLKVSLYFLFGAVNAQGKSAIKAKVDNLDNTGWY